MWKQDYKESWAVKNWFFWTVMLEKTLESPLYSKEIQPVHPKGDQSWIFIGRTDAEAETPILRPPDGKSWLTGKDPDSRKDWRWEENGRTPAAYVGDVNSLFWNFISFPCKPSYSASFLHWIFSLNYPYLTTLYIFNSIISLSLKPSPLRIPWIHRGWTPASGAWIGMPEQLGSSALLLSPRNNLGHKPCCSPSEQIGSSALLFPLGVVRVISPNAPPSQQSG